MRSASCLCESIRFELRGELQAPHYCYRVHRTKFAGTSPRMHIRVGSKPQWCAIHDDLPQHDTNPGNRAVDTETT